MRTARCAAWCVWLAAAVSATASKPCPSASTAQSWIDCGLEAQKAGRFADAQTAFDSARDIAQRAGDQAGLARALEGAGDMRQVLGHLTEAEPMLRESLRIREALHDQAQIAAALAALGRFYITAGDDLKTREYFERSMKIDEQLGNRLGVAMAMNNIGISWKPHDVLVALDYFQKSMDELTQLGEERRANIVRNNIALMYYQLGDLDRAIDLAKTALATWDRVGAGDRAGVVESSLGIDYLELGDYRTALQFLQKSLAIRLKQGYTFAVAESWNNLALLYRAQGDYDQARSALEKSIALSRKLENHDLEAEGLANLGEVQYLAGQRAEAVQSLRASLEIAEKLDVKLKIGFVSYNLGRVYLSQRKLDEASRYLNRSLETEEQIHDGLEQGQTLVALAETEGARGNFSESRQFALRAVTLGEQTGQPEVQWAAQSELGRAEKSLGRREQAKEAFDRAIGVLEDLRTRVAGGESQQAIFFANKTEPYQERMALALDSGNAAEAFHYAERARARALLDTFNGRRPPLSKTMTAQEHTEEQRLRLALNAVSQQIRLSKESDDLLRTRQEQARLDYEAFQTRLYAAHPELRIARAQIPTIGVRETQALLHGPGAALLEFAVTPQRTWLFVITSGGLRSVEVKISSAALASSVERFRQQLASRDLRVDQAARGLYTLLLGPAGNLLTGKTDWTIAPDGPLWNLPFQALESKPGRFVIEDASVSYAQSFTALREEMRLAARRRTTPGTLLGFGNPAGRDRLPEAERQIQAVSAVYHPAGRAYTGTAASEDRWKREAPGYRILEFATHAVFDDRSPLYSYIALAEPPAGSSEDGLLEAWEIMQLNLSAELSVLSACETARGGVTPGEGLIGLTWALFVAGSPSALVTQWKVDAATTTDLMIEFHRTWRGGTGEASKTRALQTAQLHLLHKLGSHPFEWAGVMLVGDAR
jgi:CHAT domain-containing protein/Tfp pilus assembly protein PilF